MDRSFVALDEITIPYGRWHYIRDEEEFKVVLDELKNKKEFTTTDSVTEEQTEDITEDLSAFGPRDRLTSNIDKQLAESKPEEFEVEVTDYSADIKVYGSQYDKSFTDKLRDHSLFLKFCIVIIAIIGGIFLFDSAKKSTGKAELNFQDIVQAGLEYEKAGNLLEAKKMFQKASGMQEKNTEVILHLAPLLIEDHQTVEATRLLEEQVEIELGLAFRKKLYNLIGLAALKNFDYEKAQENFDKSLKIDSNYVPALFNSAVTSYYNDNFDEALDFVTRAIAKSVTKTGVLLILLTEIELQVSQKSDALGPEYLNKIYDFLEQYVMFGRDYVQEIYFLMAYISHVQEKQHKVEENLELMLDQDPELTADHVEDLSMFRERSSWEHLSTIFKRMHEGMKRTPRASVAYGLSLFLGKEKLEGKRIIEEAVAQAPDDHLIQAVFSYVKHVFGHGAEAKAANKIALEGKGYKLPLILKGKYCTREKNYPCAKEAWRDLLDMDPKNISAIGGLGQIFYDQKNFTTAKAKVQEGLAFSSNYKPLLDIQLKIKKEAK